MNLYLGVDISSLPDKKGFTLSQPFLIDRVIQALNFDTKATKSATNNTLAGYPNTSKTIFWQGHSHLCSEVGIQLVYCL